MGRSGNSRSLASPRRFAPRERANREQGPQACLGLRAIGSAFGGRPSMHRSAPRVRRPNRLAVRAATSDPILCTEPPCRRPQRRLAIARSPSPSAGAPARRSRRYLRSDFVYRTAVPSAAAATRDRSLPLAFGRGRLAARAAIREKASRRRSASSSLQDRCARSRPAGRVGRRRFRLLRARGAPGRPVVRARGSLRR